MLAVFIFEGTAEEVELVAYCAFPVVGEATPVVPVQAGLREDDVFVGHVLLFGGEMLVGGRGWIVGKGKGVTHGTGSCPVVATSPVDFVAAIV